MMIRIFKSSLYGITLCRKRFHPKAAEGESILPLLPVVFRKMSKSPLLLGLRFLSGKMFLSLEKRNLLKPEFWRATFEFD